MRRFRTSLVVMSTAVLVVAADPAPAPAFNPIKPICGVAGFLSGLAGKACNVAQHGGRLLKAGGQLLTGHIGGAAKALVSATPSPTAAAIGLTAIGAWVLVGARASLQETAKVIARTTKPELGTTWFSTTYWRMAGLAALLTLPFLFAAAVQALIRSDLALLVRAAFGYLPLAMLVISIAAPLTMLLLAASDQMSAIVSSAAGNAGVRFLQHAGGLTIGLSTVSGSPFLAFFVGLLTAAGAVVLWLELLMREAAVYVVVLMLPMAFAALVWPARRIWAVRTSELLVALILSKFAIVAVLALAGAALGRKGADGAGGMLSGMVLVALGAFTPWALLRLLPLAELASGAAGSLRGEVGRLRASADAADLGGGQAGGWAGALSARMRSQAEEAAPPLDERRDGAGAELPKLTDEGGRRDMSDPIGVDDVEANLVATPATGTSAAAAVGSAAPGPTTIAGPRAPGGSGSGAPGVAAPGSAGTGGHPPAESRERPPDIWAAPDGAWRVMDLGGPDEDWRRVWPREDSAGSRPGAPRVDGPSPAGETGGADDHDPLPPPQDPENGRL